MPGQISPSGSDPHQAGPSIHSEPQFDIVRFAAGLVCAAIIIAALYYGRDFLIPLAFAFLISFALDPFVTRLSRIGLSRIFAVIVVMTAVVAVIAGFGLLLGAQVRSVSQELPTYQSTIRGKLADLRSQMHAPGIFEGAIKTVESMKKQVEAAPKETASRETPQKVEVVPPPDSPVDTAVKWLAPTLEPLATAGIVFVFVFMALLDRGDLRDRLLGMAGGNLNRSTVAVEEAGKRISRYLLMQLIVNVSYGVPIALGLWWIGVPGALLWGTVAAVMRFVPYVGPMISAIFPIALAFAVDPGWQMLLWTVGLIVVLELLSNNVVEPLLYGTSTGLSAMALIASATFWTVLWGPVGLILATPLTVCLLVLGRNIPQLKFFDTLLGSTTGLSLPERVYQRLIADDPDEAIEIASEVIAETSVRQFYGEVGIPTLRLASVDHLNAATAEHRLRVVEGMDAMLDDLREQHPSPGDAGAPARVVCIGGKWELDTIAAQMLAHAISLEGIPVAFRSAGVVTADYIAKLDLDGVDVVCLSYLSAQPAAPARHFSRRLRTRWPDLQIILALWNCPPELLENDRHEKLGADDVAISIDEAVLRVESRLTPTAAGELMTAEKPSNDAERVAALEATGILDGHIREEFDDLAKRAADVFDVKFAVISAIDSDREFIIGQSMDLPGSRTTDGTDMITMPRSEAVCDHVVSKEEAMIIPDTERDPRFADHPAIALWGTRFYAGAPLKTKDGFVLGALCLLDTEPRSLNEEEIQLLNEMADDAILAITGDRPAAEGRDKLGETGENSATVGQRVPR